MSSLLVQMCFIIHISTFTLNVVFTKYVTNEIKHIYMYTEDLVTRVIISYEIY